MSRSSPWLVTLQLLGLLLAAPLVCPGAAGANQGADDLAAVVEDVTRELVGREYLLSPLGEGHPPDTDPRLRLDAFDCTTFAETALALALAEDRDEVLPWLDRIRYEGSQVEFEARRHLMAAQWIPGLQDLGFLREATDAVTGTTMPRVRLELDLERWRQRTVAVGLDLPDERVPVGSYELPYLPLAGSAEVLGAAEPGLLINVVRVPSAKAPIVITHQALLLEAEDGQRVIRHASGRYGRVVDQPIHDFVADLERPHAWPIAGLNLQRLSRPRER